VPKAGAAVRSFDQARDVGHHEAATIVQTDDTEVRLQRGEGIVCDLGAGRRDARNQRGLARVREAYQTHIGQ
jgi:hypothetical protein